ncbi:MAG: glycerate kinase [Rubrivivax sp.]|nr:MAG: glycerate kinase [Rubrivivax sp.]
MNLQKFLVPVGAVILAVAAYRTAGWGGVAIVGGALVMWLLLHFTRMMQVLKRAADRPKGYVESAVMLNAKLKPKFTLLHVTAMTNSLGLPQSPEGVQPEVFRWTDNGGSHVTAEFAEGKLVKWVLWRPPVEDDAAPTPLA